MKVLKATQEQYEQLNGYQNEVHRLEFIKDANDNWIVGMQVLNCSAFESILDQLNELEEIDYMPIQEVENE